MNLEFQSDALFKLSKLVDSDKHSIIISGSRGCGKTYLASQFAKLHKIATFNVVQPKVGDLKTLIDDSYRLQDNQVICIENLDDGTDAASQVILKYLEEPLSNVYIIVTCINSSKLPSTIVSRSIEVAVPNPYLRDLQAYGQFLNAQKYQLLRNYIVLSAAKSLNDIHLILNLNIDQIKYYEIFNQDEFWKKSIDEILWNLGHYPDNSKSNVPLVFKVIRKCYIKNMTVSKNVHSAALEALLALESKRISETAILGKFVLSIRN